MTASSAAVSSFNVRVQQSYFTSSEDVVELGFRIRDVKEAPNRGRRRSKESRPVSITQMFASTRRTVSYGRDAFKSEVDPAASAAHAIRVLSADPTPQAPEEVPLDKYHEVYRSESRRDVNVKGALFSSLLLLPMKTKDGKDEPGMELPLRIELWVGSSRKALNPDIQVGSTVTTLTTILQKMGELGLAHSLWVSFNVQSETTRDIVASVDIRVAFPARLTSVIPSSTAHPVHEWRSRPAFLGVALRGFFHGPLSRGFQTLLREGEGGNTTDSTAASAGAGLAPGVHLIEFREEMAEMPLDFLVPAVFLESLMTLLTVAVETEPHHWKSEYERYIKIFRRNGAIEMPTGQKEDDLHRKWDRGADQAKERLAKRLASASDCAQAYRQQWDKLTSVRSAAPVDATANAGAQSTRISMRVTLATAQQSLGSSTRSVESSSPSFNFNLGGSATQILGGNVSVFEEIDSTVVVSSSGASVAQEDDDDDEAQEDNERAALEAQLVGTTNPLVGGAWKGPGDPRAFCPSMSRMDKRCMYVPINMHLQVLTVRETDVLAEGSGRPNVGMMLPKPRPGGVFRRASTIIQNMVSGSAASTTTTTATALSVGFVGGGSRSPADVPGNTDGPLAQSIRRTGRKSIMAPTTSSQPSMPNGTSRARQQTMSLGGISEHGPNNNGGNSDFALSDSSQKFLYDLVSVGAPSAHSIKGSGLNTLAFEITRLEGEQKRALKDDETKNFGIEKRLDALRALKETELAFSERIDVVFAQALTTVVSSIVARLLVMSASAGFEDDDDVASAILRCGFLIGWESLLSTGGSELAMLEDMSYIVRFITDRVRIQLRAAELPTTQSLDVQLHLTNLKPTVTASPTEDGPASLISPLLGWGPGHTREAHVWVVTVTLPHVAVDLLATSLRDHIMSSSRDEVRVVTGLHGDKLVDYASLSPAPLPVTVLLFTQGINEMQTISNYLHRLTLQEHINTHSTRIMSEYCESRFGGPTAPTSEAGKRALAHSMMWLAKLRSAVRRQDAYTKNWEILTTSADLVRCLGGIRICSCKSAKDRSAMSVTYEEGRLLIDVHHAAGTPTDAANLLRKEGTRLLCAYKNTSIPRYAFNSAQRFTLPDPYRPPFGTIGSFLRTGNVT